LNAVKPERIMRFRLFCGVAFGPVQNCKMYPESFRGQGLKIRKSPNNPTDCCYLTIARTVSQRFNPVRIIEIMADPIRILRCP
jgi:hypothetical protein